MARFWEQLTLSRAPISGLAMVGVFWGGFAGLMPDIKLIAGVSDGTFGLIMMLSALGSMTAMFLSPRIVAALGRWTLPLVGLALLLAFHFPIFATDATRLGFAVLFMGATVGLLDISSNIRVSGIEAESGLGLMNLNHAGFSFAFGGAALITGLAREAGMGPAQILPGLAGIAAFLAILTIERPEKFHISDEDRADAANTRPTGTFWPVVLLTSVVLFGSFIGENSTEAWSALHIERTLGAEVGHGSYGPAVLGFVMGICRLFGQIAADRIGERSLIIWSAVLGVLGASLIAVAWTPFIVFVGVAIVAAGMAVIVPSANTVLGRRVPRALQGLALSRAWMIGMTGFFIGPAMMGLIAEFFGLRVSYGIIALIVALIIPSMVALGRIPALAHTRAAAASGAA